MRSATQPSAKAGGWRSGACSRPTSGSAPPSASWSGASAEGTTSDRPPRTLGCSVDAVTRHRDTIDAEIERVAPAYPVVQLARIDRALLRSAMGELLHCPATPARVAIAEWVELARTYSGEPARRLINGVLGRVAEDATERPRTEERPTTGQQGEASQRPRARRREHQVTASTYERLKKIVVEQLGVDEDEVKPEASFVDDLNADSLDLVELIMSLEEEFGTEISDEDAEKIRTVQDAVDYIDEHRNQ